VAGERAFNNLLASGPVGRRAGARPLRHFRSSWYISSIAGLAAQQIKFILTEDYLTMCGICGFSWQDEGLVRAMNDRLVHRGPDQHGLYVGQGASLGHRRLSIIDLSENGRQPMANEDNTVFLVINGEIYNHEDLRKELIAKGHIFHSRSDSEAVLHGYEEWGEKVCEKLSGMFCFAVLDTVKRRISWAATAWASSRSIIITTAKSLSSPTR
jgi:hypothetical protein